MSVASIPPSDELDAVVRRELSTVEGVEGVLLGRSDGGQSIRIYAVVREHSRELRARLLQAEDRLLDALSGLRVDIGVRAHHGAASAESLAAGCRYLSLV